jgi:hypothetical protein
MPSLDGCFGKMRRLQKRLTKYLGIFTTLSFLFLNLFNNAYAATRSDLIYRSTLGDPIAVHLIDSASGIARVWAVDDGEKIKRGDLNHPLANSPDNPVWDGERIQLFGAKNEIVAFQIIIQAGSSDVRNVNVRITALSQGAYRIPGSDEGSSDPYDYRDRYVELFTEHYIKITERSRGGSAWTAAAAPSDYYLGWVPDALIPFSAAAGKGGAPFDIPASTNQGVWVDLYIPRDSQAGLFAGEVQVSVGGTLTHQIPIDLQVYDFTLPDETHFNNMFAIEGSDIAQRHGVTIDSEEYYEILTRYYQMAHRHRFDLVQAVRNLSQVRRFHNRYLTGTLYASKYGYEGPGEGVGNNMFSIGLYGNVPNEYGESSLNWSQEGWWEGSDLWAAWFNENASHVTVHKFLFPDEPESDSDLRAIKAQAEWSHNNPNVGASIPTFVTHWIDPEYREYVDIWSTSANHTLSGVYPGTDPQEVQTELEAGKRLGVYNGYRPATGSTLIDTDAVDFRVIPWIGWKYDLDHYFYWMTTHWNDQSNNSKRTNVFSNPRTTEFQRNGAGTFFYPGQDMVYIEQDRGLAGPLASIRMKNWRRGMQDYEYLWLAREMGLADDVEQIVDQIVPAALWEADASGDISWSEDGFGFEISRRELADLISGHLETHPLVQMQVEKPALTDITPDHPYYDQINLVYQLGYMGGCSQDPAQFCADQPLTRAEGAVLFGRMIYGTSFVPDSPSEQVFVDMPLSGDYDWATPWATALWLDGYVSGCALDPLSYCPGDALPRVDSVVLVLRSIHGADYVPPAPEGVFADLSVRNWEAKWAEAAHGEGLLEPCNATERMRFCPYGTLSRGEAAAMIVNALGLAID